MISLRACFKDELVAFVNKRMCGARPVAAAPSGADGMPHGRAPGCFIEEFGPHAVAKVEPPAPESIVV